MILNGIPQTWGPREFKGFAKGLIEAGHLRGTYEFLRQERTNGTRLTQVRLRLGHTASTSALITLQKLTVRIGEGFTIEFTPARRDFTWLSSDDTIWTTIIEGDAISAH